MDLGFLVIQFLNGLASASSLFLVAAGLSLIFGVGRIVNFAHGSLFMLGAYLTVALVPAVGFWAAVLLAPPLVALIGGLIERLILRPIAGAPELFQLLATFGVSLMVADVVILVWGAADIVGPRAPGLDGAVSVLGKAVPLYDLMLIAVGPAVLGGLWLLLTRTRAGLLVRAAAEDRDMVDALGRDPKRLFSGVFMLGALLAGLGGALAVPRETLHSGLDLQVIVEAFAVVVVGGMGSVGGAYGAAVLIGLVHAFGIVWFPEATLVLTFLVMALVLMLRPHGLFGARAGLPAATGGAAVAPPLTGVGRLGGGLWLLAALGLLAAPLLLGAYGLDVLAEMLILAAFAASLQWLTGVAGIVSFGHAAFFGLGGYAAALMVHHLGWGMIPALLAGSAAAALAGALLGRVGGRLSGVYLAMLSLAFAELLHAVAFQWVGLTGGDNGLIGLWPPAWAADPRAYYGLTLLLAGGAVAGLAGLAFTPHGRALRALRDHPVRAAALGLDVAGLRRRAMVLAGAVAGLAGGLFVFLKGSVFPGVLGVAMSVDALVMMLLGGLHALGGALLGAAAYQGLFVAAATLTDHWRLVLGGLIVLLVVALPGGLGSLGRRLRGRSA
ncbi:ABC transporter permease [Roseospirillum parvum]|uniref:Branched-chain amino acid transport system permease protein n=1 Tax=Roseospirillum parvum TaxID=83401 RepID=A0A1G7U506_9PROT|nr:ABC transporter permease [Roseospirillum parvum]SDG42139.1 branched-chain amino acid transport system permease protein [Roseospirillum parvum]